MKTVQTPGTMPESERAELESFAVGRGRHVATAARRRGLFLVLVFTPSACSYAIEREDFARVREGLTLDEAVQYLKTIPVQSGAKKTTRKAVA